MAITFDATVGGTATNSYVTVAEANDYFDRYVYPSGVTAWPSGSATATVTLKENYLMAATTSVDENLFINYKYDDDQALQFPRYMQDDVEVIPEEIKRATYEEALAVLNGCSGADKEIYNGYTSEKLGSTSVNYGFKRGTLRSYIAWGFLRDWLVKGI